MKRHNAPNWPLRWLAALTLAWLCGADVPIWLYVLVPLGVGVAALAWAAVAGLIKQQKAPARRPVRRE